MTVEEGPRGTTGARPGTVRGPETDTSTAETDPTRVAETGRAETAQAATVGAAGTGLTVLTQGAKEFRLSLQTKR